MISSSPVIIVHKPKVQFFLSCSKLRGFTPKEKIKTKVQLILMNDTSQNEEVIDETEEITDDLNPEYTKPITIIHSIEEIQSIKFAIGNVDLNNSFNVIGYIETTIAAIMHTKNTNRTSIYEILSSSRILRGTMTIRWEPYTLSRECLLLQFIGNNIYDAGRNCLCFGATNPLFKLIAKDKEQKEMQVYKSEPVLKKLNPEWNEFEINLDLLCLGDYNKEIKLLVYTSKANGKTPIKQQDQHRKQQNNQNDVEIYIGELSFTLKDILILGKKSFEIRNIQTNKLRGIIFLKKVEKFIRNNLLDYLVYDGITIENIFAIDCTKANGDQNNTNNNLHCIKKKKKNSYEKVLDGIMNRLSPYSKNQRVGMFGFGAKPRYKFLNNNSTLEFFACNGDENSLYVTGIQEIQKAYELCVNSVEFSSPCNICPLLKQVHKMVEEIKNQGYNQYIVFSILIAGNVDDIEEAIVCVKNMVDLPLSIIFIGIGKGNLNKMEMFNNIGSISRAGQTEKREVCTFVNVQKYDDSEDLAVKDGLSKVVKHLVGYYSAKKITPKILPKGRLASLLEPQNSLTESRNKLKRPITTASSLVETLDKEYSDNLSAKYQSSSNNIKAKSKRQRLNFLETKEVLISKKQSTISNIDTDDRKDNHTDKDDTWVALSNNSKQEDSNTSFLDQKHIEDIYQTILCT